MTDERGDRKKNMLLVRETTVSLQVERYVVPAERVLVHLYLTHRMDGFQDLFLFLISILFWFSD